MNDTDQGSHAPQGSPAGSGKDPRTVTIAPPKCGSDSKPATSPATNPLSGSGTIIEPSSAPEPVAKPPKAALPAFPGYEVLCELGRGAMGVVYKARNKKLPDKIVAIKVLSRSGAGNIDELNRFRGEAEMVSALAHENIVQIYDIETHNGLTYLILEYVDGGTLSERIRSSPPTPREAAAIVEKIARAIDFAHQKKIIHRDLKPANVLMTKSGTPKVTDFGLGKLLDRSEGAGQTHSGVIMGTPAYMAPEQAGGRSREFGPATDVYALGAILYEMLTRRAVFMGDNLTSLLQQVENNDPVPPSYLVPLKAREKELSTLCLKCLEKNPSRRFPTAGELANELRRWLDDQPIVTRPISPLGKMRRYVAKHPLPVALAASVLALVVMASAGAVLLTRQDAKDARMKLEEEHKERVTKQFQNSLGALNAVLDEVAGSPDGQHSGLKATRLVEILLGYYRQLADRNNINYLDERERQQLTDRLTRLAELVDRVGDSGQSLEILGTARYIISRESNQDSPETRLRAARVAGQQGRVLSAYESRRDEAEQECMKGVELLAPVADANLAESDRAKRLRSGIYHTLGTINSERREKLDGLDTAAHYYKKALDDRRGLAPLTDPLAQLRDLRELGRIHGYLGDVYLKKGEFREADRHYWQSHAIRSKAVHEYEKILGDYDRAVPPRIGQINYAVAQSELEEARCQLARSFGNLGNLQYCSDRPHTAHDFYGKAQELMSDLVKKYPDDVFYKNDFCYLTNRYVLMRWICADGQPSDSSRQELVALAEKALACSEAVRKAQPDSSEGRTSFIRGNLLLAELLFDEDYERARNAFLKVNDLFNKKPAPSDSTPEMQFEMARRDGILCEIRQNSKTSSLGPNDLKNARERLETALKNGALGKQNAGAVVNEYRSFKVLRPASN